MKLRKDFINRYVKPLVGTDSLHGALEAIFCVKKYNSQYYGETIDAIQRKYRNHYWLSGIMFRLGYLQTLADTKQDVAFDFTYRDMNYINNAIDALDGLGGVLHE